MIIAIMILKILMLNNDIKKIYITSKEVAGTTESAKERASKSRD